jgi:hypothetical protein
MALGYGKGSQTTAHAREKNANKVGNISVFNAKSPEPMAGVVMASFQSRVRNANSSCDFTKGISLKKHQLSLANVLDSDFHKKMLRQGIGRSVQNL